MERMSSIAQHVGSRRFDFVHNGLGNIAVYTLAAQCIEQMKAEGVEVGIVEAVVDGAGVSGAQFDGTTRNRASQDGVQEEAELSLLAGHFHVFEEDVKEGITQDALIQGLDRLLNGLLPPETMIERFHLACSLSPFALHAFDVRDCPAL